MLIDFLRQYKIPVIFGFLIILFSFFIGFTVSANMYNKEDLNNIEDLSFQEKLESLKKSYEYYTKKVTSEEVLVRWIKLFSRSKYQLNGDGKYNRYDCVSSCYYFFNSFGSAVKVKTVKETKTLLDKFVSMGYGEKRNNFYEIKVGDILISHNATHMSIVVNKSENFITYVDVNYKLKGMGIQNIYYKDQRITGIYSMPFQLWSGDLLKFK